MSTNPMMTIVKIPSWTLGEEFSITLTPFGAVTTSINYTCGTASGVVATDVPYSTGSVKCTLPRSLASQNTSGEFVTVTFEVITCVDGVETGSYTVNQSFEIPVDVCPSCSITVSEPTGYSSKFGGYLMEASAIKIDVTPVLAYESEIIDCTIEAGGWTMHGGSATWRFYFDTDVNIKATVTDARGRSYTAEKNITLIDYAYPTIGLLTAVRCDANGNEDKQGSNIKVTFSGTVDPVNNKNTVAYGLKYKKTTDADYTAVALSQTAYTTENATYIFAADTATGYDVVLTLTDAVDSVERTTTAPSGFVLMDFKSDGTAMAIGKAAETSDMFDVGLAANFDKGITVADGEPTGFKVKINSDGVIMGTPEGEIPVYNFYLSKSAAMAALLAQNITIAGNTRTTIGGGILDITSLFVNLPSGTRYNGTQLSALFAEKAPSGFGLGSTSGKEITDCNTAIENGFYSLSGASLTNGPPWYLGYGNMIVLNRYSNTHITQVAFYLNFVCIRYYSDGAWSAWEWVNPPMELGVEYRTTKRHNGKVVYAKCISFGTLPNTTTKTVSLGVTGASIVSVGGRAYSSSYEIPLLANKRVQEIYYVKETGGMAIQTNADASAYSAELTVEYTKP